MIRYLLAAAVALAIGSTASARPAADLALWRSQALELELARSTSKTVLTGPRGGRYYINKNGKKTYCGKKNPRC